MISMLPRSKLLQSMTSQELVELSQLEHDTLLNKLNSSKISLPSLARIYGLLSNLTSPGLCWQEFSSLFLILKTTEPSPHTSNSPNKLTDSEWYRPFRNSFIRKWEQPLGSDMITTPTLRVNSPLLPVRLQLSLV